MTYLYQIPKDSKIYVEASDGSSYVTFHDVDGMYSYCTTEKTNGIVHLSRMTPLKAKDDGYEIAEQENNPNQ